MSEITLESLVGRHKLSGVSYNDERSRKNRFGQIENVIFFTLDGITYAAAENPEDDYRSMMGTLETSETAPSNTFDPVDVAAAMDATENILIITDIKSGLVVLEVGTNYSDHDYPFFVNHWWPENLAVNRSQK